MTLSDVPLLMLGAALVASGVLAAALADRIRGNRAQHEATLALLDASENLPRAHARRVARTGPVPMMSPAPVFATEFVSDDPGKTVRPRRSASGSASGTPNGVPVAKVANAQMAADVIAALVNAGYHKTAATAAVMACVPTEQTSLSNWTLAALRRCARGEVVS